MLYSAPFCGADILNVVKIDAVFGTKEHVGFGGPRPQVRNGRPEKVMPSEDAAIFMLNSPGRRREFCHFDDTPFCFPIETPTKCRGGGAAEWQSRRRLDSPDRPKLMAVGSVKSDSNSARYLL